MRLRNHRERRTSHLSDVQEHQLENPRDTKAGGAEMTQATKDPKDQGGAQEQAQRDLTASVGTPLVRPEKDKKRRLFGGRRKSSTSGS
jgi:hypothetical protein